MIRVIAVGGEPATGKTTLMFKLIDMADDWVTCKPEKLLDALYSKTLNTYILGKYEKGSTFQGTDRLSMAVQPDAEKFISSLNYEDSDVNVIFEGDRLFNSKFLEHCSKNTKRFNIILLQVAADIVKQRHINRNDTQTEKFINGRKTKLDNISSSLVLMDYISVRENNTVVDQQKIISDIVNYFKWSENNATGI
jgi:dephospho-CoA kinase